MNVIDIVKENLLTKEQYCSIILLNIKYFSFYSMAGLDNSKDNEDYWRQYKYMIENHYKYVNVVFAFNLDVFKYHGVI